MSVMTWPYRCKATATWLTRWLNCLMPGTRPAFLNPMITGMRHPPIDTCRNTSLGDIAVLIRNAASLVSNCTGVSHIAAAFKTPSIVISMDGEPERWRPIDKTLHHTIDWLSQPDFQNLFVETQNLLQNDLTLNSIKIGVV